MREIRKRRGEELARRAPPTLAALLCVGTLLIAPTAAASAQQAHLSGFVGGYDRGDGDGHPFVWLAVGGRLGAQVIDPVSAELEGLHVPLVDRGTPVDLFAFRLNVRAHREFGFASPFILAGVGSNHWRIWTAGEGNFDDVSGTGITLGVGSRFHGSEPVSLRLDLRRELSAFEAPIPNRWVGTLAVELRL